MRFLLRALALFFIVSAVLSLVRSMFASATRPAPKVGNSPPRPVTTGRLVKDPVCGMYVPEESAIQGNGNFFCSEECRKKSLA
jgi:uncharacterized protein